MLFSIFQGYLLFFSVLVCLALHNRNSSLRRHLALIVVHHRVLEDEEYKEYKKQKDLTTARITHITTDRQATGGVPLYLAPHTGGGRPFPISTAMKNSRRIAVAVGSLLLADAAHLVHAEGGSGVVQWGIQKRPAPEDLRNKNRFRKRASTYEEVITNEESRGGYFATCRLGTPGQDLTLQLDTGSSDIWVPDSTAAVCRTDTTSSSSSSGGGCTFGSCMSVWSGVHEMGFRRRKEMVRTNTCS